MKRNSRFIIHNSQFTIISALCIVHCALSIFSCKLINPADPIPAYVRIDTIPLTTDPSTQGTSNNAITDAWVYIDDQIIGVYQMPVSVPVLYSGAHTLTLGAGVIVNGIAGTRTNYPFYTNFVQTVNLDPGKINTITVQPPILIPTALSACLKILTKEETSFTRDPQSADSLHIISDSSVCLKGSGKCGASLLNANCLNFVFVSTAGNDSFPMPQGSLQYMELNYKSNYPFTIGILPYQDGVLLSNSPNSDILTLNPSGTWQKIYISLNLVTDQYTTADHFKIYMYGNLDLTVQPAASIYFDNIKVIHNG